MPVRIYFFDHRNRFNQRIVRVALCLAMFTIFVFKVGVSWGQTDTNEQEKKKKPAVEFLNCQVHVTDPDGHPLSDATVYCTGLRTRQDSGSHWLWDEKAWGPVPKVQTDSDGLAIMKYPKFTDEKMETGWMTWSVDHDGFVSFREDRDVSDAPAEIQLQRGFRVALTAKNAQTGQPIKDDLYAIIGLEGRGNWKLKKNGTLVSGTLRSKNCQLCVMHLAKGKPALFSDLIDVQPGDQSRLLLHDVELSPGVRLEGKLDDAIDRPIKNGYVSGEANLQFDGTWETHWSWADKAEIKEDGTFVFESLPRGVVWQMLPFCDGWVPGDPSLDSVAQHFPEYAANQQNRIGGVFRQPQLLKLDALAMTKMLKMKPAASVEITCVDQDGKPVPEIEVAMWPNQLWFRGGSSILGDAYSTRALLEARRHDEEFKRPRGNKFSGKTNGDGVVVIDNLPAIADSKVAIVSEQYELPLAGNRRVFSFSLKEYERKQRKVTLKLQPKGTGARVGDEGDFDLDFDPPEVTGIIQQATGVLDRVLDWVF